MTADRIKEIQSKTAFPDSVSVCQALLQVWNECEQERMYSKEDIISFAHFYFQKEFNSTMQTSKSTDEIFKEWFEQFKK